MTLLLLVFGFVLLALATVFRLVLAALLVQEVKGALADRLRRDVDNAAALLADDELRAQMHAEWLGELGAASDRPLKAVFMVRGFTVAARTIAADSAPVPVTDAGPTFVERVQQTAAGRAARLAERVGQFNPRSVLAQAILRVWMVVSASGMLLYVASNVGQALLVALTLVATAASAVVYIRGR
jgi:hypothetical protein